MHPLIFATTTTVVISAPDLDELSYTSGVLQEEGVASVVVARNPSTVRFELTGNVTELTSFTGSDGSTVSPGSPLVLSQPLGDAELYLGAGGRWRYDTGEQLLTGTAGPYTQTGDVDGDGRVDVCSLAGIILTTSDDLWTVAPFPNDLPANNREDHNACMPDLTGDGLADLISAEWHIIDPYFFPAVAGPVSLYAGGPGGYASTPLWTEELFFDAPYAMVAVQRDDDPELELAALTRPVYRYGDLESSSLVLIDDVATAPRRVGAYPATIDNGFELWSFGTAEPRLVNLGDVDGDGYDDLLLPEAYGYKFDDTRTEEPHHFRIVSSASSEAVVDELATLRFDAPVAEIEAMDFGVGDVNGDEVPDLFGFVCDDREGCWLQVWYGPLSTLLESPSDTGETGDTGTHATGDTAPQAPTGDTAEPDARAAEDTTVAMHDDPGCGCGIPTRTASLSFFRRRRSR